MEIRYKSTRSSAEPVTASQAILTGLSPDGGLYVPTEIPALACPLEDLAKMSYRDLAFTVMRPYLSDFTDEEIKACIDAAYDEKFDDPLIAPVVKADGAYYLELFHGPTIAFKDMALTILPHFMVTSARKNGVKNDIVILTATSGDTGKAAMSGFADVPGTQIIVFYPKDGVSEIQEKQMITQRGENTHVAAIHGNFDDAQTGVKKMFGDPKLKADMDAAGFQFSSANSINVGRLVPQIAYYVYAYSRLVAMGEIKAGDCINVTVPTGNFGNILAAYYAKCMGLPIRKLICASNANNVLTDFFNTGVYNKKRPFILTSSPSMDILVSSNLERLIYEIAGFDAEACAAFMDDLSKGGEYVITDAMKDGLKDFIGGFATEEENFAGIRDLFEKEKYVIDTHTGIANAVYRKYAAETGDTTPTVIASTASAYKFSPAVVGSIAPEEAEGKSEFEMIDTLTKIAGTKEPFAITDIRTAPVRHNTVIDKEEMEATVRGMMGLQ